MELDGKVVAILGDEYIADNIHFRYLPRNKKPKSVDYLIQQYADLTSIQELLESYVSTHLDVDIILLFPLLWEFIYMEWDEDLEVNSIHMKENIDFEYLFSEVRKTTDKWYLKCPNITFVWFLPYTPDFYLFNKSSLSGDYWQAQYIARTFYCKVKELGEAWVKNISDINFVDMHECFFLNDYNCEFTFHSEFKDTIQFPNGCTKDGLIPSDKFISKFLTVFQKKLVQIFNPNATNPADIPTPTDQFHKPDQIERYHNPEPVEHYQNPDQIEQYHINSPSDYFHNADSRKNVLSIDYQHFSTNSFKNNLPGNSNTQSQFMNQSNIVKQYNYNHQNYKDIPIGNTQFSNSNYQQEPSNYPQESSNYPQESSSYQQSSNYSQEPSGSHFIQNREMKSSLQKKSFNYPHHYNEDSNSKYFKEPMYTQYSQNQETTEINIKQGASFSGNIQAKAHYVGSQNDEKQEIKLTHDQPSINNTDQWSGGSKKAKTENFVPFNNASLTTHYVEGRNDKKQENKLTPDQPSISNAAEWSGSKRAKTENVVPSNNASSTNLIQDLTPNMLNSIKDALNFFNFNKPQENKISQYEGYLKNFFNPLDWRNLFLKGNAVDALECLDFCVNSLTKLENKKGLKVIMITSSTNFVSQAENHLKSLIESQVIGFNDFITFGKPLVFVDTPTNIRLRIVQSKFQSLSDLAAVLVFGDDFLTSVSPLGIEFTYLINSIVNSRNKDMINKVVISESGSAEQEILAQDAFCTSFLVPRREAEKMKELELENKPSLTDFLMGQAQEHSRDSLSSSSRMTPPVQQNLPHLHSGKTLSRDMDYNQKSLSKERVVYHSQKSLSKERDVSYSNKFLSNERDIFYSQKSLSKERDYTHSTDSVSHAPRSFSKERSISLSRDETSRSQKCISREKEIHPSSSSRTSNESRSPSLKRNEKRDQPSSSLKGSDVSSAKLTVVKLEDIFKLARNEVSDKSKQEYEQHDNMFMDYLMSMPYSVQDSYLVEGKQAVEDHDSNYRTYQEVPDLHPIYEDKYEFFIKIFEDAYGKNCNPKHIQTTWKRFWDITITSLKDSEWLVKKKDLQKEFMKKYGKVSEPKINVQRKEAQGNQIYNKAKNLENNFSKSEEKNLNPKEVSTKNLSLKPRENEIKVLPVVEKKDVNVKQIDRKDKTEKKITEVKTITNEGVKEISPKPEESSRKRENTSSGSISLKRPISNIEAKTSLLKNSSQLSNSNKDIETNKTCSTTNQKTEALKTPPTTNRKIDAYKTPNSNRNTDALKTPTANQNIDELKTPITRNLNIEELKTNPTTNVNKGNKFDLRNLVEMRRKLIMESNSPPSLKNPIESKDAVSPAKSSLKNTIESKDAVLPAKNISQSTSVTKLPNTKNTAQNTYPKEGNKLPAKNENKLSGKNIRPNINNLQPENKTISAPLEVKSTIPKERTTLTDHLNSILFNKEVSNQSKQDNTFSFESRISTSEKNSLSFKSENKNSSSVSSEVKYQSREDKSKESRSNTSLKEDKYEKASNSKLIIKEDRYSKEDKNKLSEREKYSREDKYFREDRGRLAGKEDKYMRDDYKSKEKEDRGKLSSGKEDKYFRGEKRKSLEQDGKRMEVKYPRGDTSKSAVKEDRYRKDDKYVPSINDNTYLANEDAIKLYTSYKEEISRSRDPKRSSSEDKRSLFMKSEENKQSMNIDRFLKRNKSPPANNSKEIYSSWNVDHKGEKNISTFDKTILSSQVSTLSKSKSEKNSSTTTTTNNPPVSSNASGRMSSSFKDVLPIDKYFEIIQNANQNSVKTILPQQGKTLFPIQMDSSFSKKESESISTNEDFMKIYIDSCSAVSKTAKRDTGVPNLIDDIAAPMDVNTYNTKPETNLAVTKPTTQKIIFNLSKPKIQFSLYEALNSMEAICSKIGVMGPALKFIISTARARLPNMYESYKIFTDHDSELLVSIAIGKVKSMLSSCSASDKELFQKTILLGQKLMEEAKKVSKSGPPQPSQSRLPPSARPSSLSVLHQEKSKKNEKTRVDVEAIAKATVGSTTEDTYQFIRNTFMYKGISEPTKQELDSVFEQVSKLHFELALKY